MPVEAAGIKILQGVVLATQLIVKVALVRRSKPLTGPGHAQTLDRQDGSFVFRKGMVPVPPLLTIEELLSRGWYLIIG